MSIQCASSVWEEGLSHDRRMRRRKTDSGYSNMMRNLLRCDGFVDFYEFDNSRQSHFGRDESRYLPEK